MRAPPKRTSPTAWKPSTSRTSPPTRRPSATRGRRGVPGSPLPRRSSREQSRLPPTCARLSRRSLSTTHPAFSVRSWAMVHASCHQSREMAAGKDGGSRHARPIEQHRRIESAAIEPQAAGNRCVSQVEPAFDPCTHELQPPPAQRQPATSNEGQQRSPDAGLRRRPLGPAQADLGDVAGRTGPHQQSLGTTQPAEAVEGSDLWLCRRWTRGDESRRCACAVGGLHTPSFCVRRCALRGLPPPGSRGSRPGCHANPPRVRGRSARSETRSATAKARHRCRIHAERMRPRRCGCLRRIHRADRGC